MRQRFSQCLLLTVSTKEFEDKVCSDHWQVVWLSPSFFPRPNGQDIIVHRILGHRMP